MSYPLSCGFNGFNPAFYKVTLACGFVATAVAHRQLLR